MSLCQSCYSIPEVKGNRNPGLAKLQPWISPDLILLKIYGLF